MLRWRLWNDDRGTASLEFVTAGLILLVPLVYLVLAMSAIQAGSFAVDGASRQAVRVYVQSRDERSAEAAAERAIHYALADYGIDSAAASVSIECSPRPATCLHRSGTVSISVGVAVALPLLPTALTGFAPLAVPLRSTATERVSRFWGPE
ncbi:MAG: hypothetical protein JWM49_1213 [Microbacteriaceae bacterium]|jgi:Flp pilus assembly protein TadG|nr:hypothetical protein [Microbacteriaceae bacterium]